MIKTRHPPDFSLFTSAKSAVHGQLFQNFRNHVVWLACPVIANKHKFFKQEANGWLSNMAKFWRFPREHLALLLGMLWKVRVNPALSAPPPLPSPPCLNTVRKCVHIEKKATVKKHCNTVCGSVGHFITALLCVIFAFNLLQCYETHFFTDTSIRCYQASGVSIKLLFFFLLLT